jgi:epsilon-lactone hydrolase
MPSMRSRILYWLLRLLKRRNRLLDPHTSLQQQRAMLEAQAKRKRMPPHVEVQGTTVGTLRAEWLRPSGAASRGAILYLPGGAYTLGSIRVSRPLAARIAQASALPVLSLDYCRAPEAPFPAALEDAVTAYRWLMASGIASGRLALVGESAGGGLALATAVALRDRGAPLPAAVVCLSPVADCAYTGESMTTRAQEDPLVTREFLRAHHAHYIGAHDPRTPLISPLYADLHGLPPLLIQVGEHEVLFSDATRLVERARAAGVEATLDVGRGMWHVWHHFAGIVPESRHAIDRLAAFVCTRLRTTSAGCDISVRAPAAEPGALGPVHGTRQQGILR